ncbi:SPOR domain-containing protein [Azospirillum griseum]|uniref:SPOR domain-containing protein n=2 Tax=Azospirillum griseum TaxID=2496639 RepID=A0A3S0I487_9PROT|nr:SPOR domain-containing protein [Azospirillum griseum]
MGNGVGEGPYAPPPYGAPPQPSSHGVRVGYRPPNRLGVGFAAFGLIAFAGALMIGFRGGDRLSGDGPPLITADKTATKSRPEQPGGMDVPHQDKLVYDRLHDRGGKPNVERLLPPPEAALPRPVVTPPMPSLPSLPSVPVIGQLPTAPGGTTTVPRDTVESAALSSSAAAVTAPVAAAPSASGAKPGAQPPAKPAATANTPAASAKAPQPTTPQTTATTPPKPTASTNAASSAAKPVATSQANPPQGGATPAARPAANSQPSAAPTPVAAPRTSIAAAPIAPPPPASGATASTAAKPVPPAPTTPVPAAATPANPAKATPAVVGGAGQWRVQLASVRSEAEASAEWKRLAGRHPEALGSLSFQAAKIDLDGKGTFYRVQGTGADEARAKSICAQLRAQNVGCVVVRP